MLRLKSLTPRAREIGLRSRTDFISVINHRIPDKVPVAIWNLAPFLLGYNGIKAREYYLVPALKIKYQLSVLEDFPHAILLPGIWADFGAVVEASAFGCEVVWYEDDAPYVKPAFNSLKEISQIKQINPLEDGLMPEALKQYKYMWKYLPEEYIEVFGFLDGIAFTVGPLETSALLVGYENLLVGLYESPKIVHTLFDIVTENILIWLKAQERINGRLRHIFIADHFPSQVSKEHFFQFCFPYLKRVFDEYPKAIKMYHNEGRVEHILPGLERMGMDYFHFGTDVIKARSIGDKVVLMGNLSPTEVLSKGSPEEVMIEALECMKTGADRGGFILSSGGGMAPATSKENIRAMFEAVELYSRGLYRYS